MAQLKYLIVLLVFSSLFFSCSTEEKATLQKVAFRNTSDQALKLLVLTNKTNLTQQDTLINSVLLPNENSEIFSYYSNYLKVFEQDLSTIEIIFINNNKGYICSVFATESANYCFFGKASPLDKNSVIYNYENEIYFFDITQEDYVNAFELP